MLKLAFAAALTAMTFPIAASATIFPLSAYIDGLQEAPTPVVTPATGSATMSYNDVSNLLSWTISFSGLVGTTTNAHFHGPALPGVAAGVQIGIPHVTGVTSDTLVGSATLTATQETQLLGGLWYINIHSTFRPGGEIRGQVVPEPTTAALLALGLLGIGLAGNRRD